MTVEGKPSARKQKDNIREDTEGQQLEKRRKTPEQENRTGKKTRVETTI